MAKKLVLDTLVHPAALVRPGQTDEETPKMAEQANRECAGREIDARFREALRRGETSGDFVILDEEGDEIIDALPSKSIFDF